MAGFFCFREELTLSPIKKEFITDKVRYPLRAKQSSCTSRSLCEELTSSVRRPSSYFRLCQLCEDLFHQPIG